MKYLLNYFIIDRKSGKSFDPFYFGERKNILIAYSNCATDPNPFEIKIKNLISGLKEKRYRLVMKNII